MVAAAAIACGPAPEPETPSAGLVEVEVPADGEMADEYRWTRCSFEEQLEHLEQRAPLQGRVADAGAITSIVTSLAGEPLAGVTVVATSPALQGPRTGLTDRSGKVLVPDLPPGVFTVTYYFADIAEREPRVEVLPNETTALEASIDTSKAGGEVIETRERAPTITYGPARRCPMGDFPPWPFADRPRR